MPRRPAPTASTARDAAAAIVDRRTAHPCPHLADLDDSLEGVVAHVARHGDAGPGSRVDDVDPDVLALDAADALLVLHHLEALYATRIARWRLGVIQAGRRAGMGPTALMGPLGQRDRQGVLGIIERSRARLDPDVAAADATAARRARAGRAVEAGQLVDQGAAIVAFARGLLARGEQLPADLGELAGVDLDDVAEHLPEPGEAPAAALAATLRLIVSALAEVPLDAELRAVLVHGAQCLPGAR